MVFDNLSEGWRVCRLGDICRTASGGTPSRKNPAYFDGDIPWVKSGELEDNIITDTEEKISASGLKHSSAKVFPKGTLLMAMYGATVGKLGRLGIDAATNQAVCAIFPDKSLDPAFLWHYLRAVRDELLLKSFGAAQPNISQEFIRELEIPVPPLEEQRRIVGRIEALTARLTQAQQARQAAIAEAEMVIESFASRTLSEFSRYRKAILGSIAVLNPNKSEINELDSNLEVTFVPMSALDENTGTIARPETKRLVEVKKGYTYFAEEDVIFAKITPCMENGKCAVARNLRNGIGFGSTEFHVVRARQEVLPEWIHLNLRSRRVRDAAENSMCGAAGQQRVPIEFLQQLEIPVPPLAEQQRVCARLQEVRVKLEELRRLQREMEAELSRFLPALLAKAFRGEL